jgi:hypothetical protein
MVFDRENWPELPDIYTFAWHDNCSHGQIKGSDFDTVSD